jgi:NAD-dependent deacetylase
MLARRPEIPWKHIARIEQACRQATFNRGHAVLAEMERHFPRVWILTQNVDGFHQGVGSRHVIDIHGDIHILDCTRCAHTRVVPDYSALEKLPPLCPACGAVLRPRVVLFNEQLPVDKLSLLNAELQQGFNLLFSIGTSSLFPYISGPVWAAQRAGLPTVEINPQRTLLSDSVTVKIRLPAAVALDALWAAYRNQHPGLD